MVSPSESAAIRRNLISSYNQVVGGIDEQAAGDTERAYGGVIRTAKGNLVEKMAPEIIKLAWREAGGIPECLTFGDTKRYRLPIKSAYVNRLPAAVKREIVAQKNRYYYNVHVDVHVFVDKKLVMGVECKAYAETAMLKRILVDFNLLKSLHPNLICCLLQLESMLGGDYSEPVRANAVALGSPSAHTLMSYFPGVDLNILTLLEGERKVDRPIHIPAYFKELPPYRLDYVINRFQALLRPLL